MSGTFTFEDFLRTLINVQRMGPFKSLIGSSPDLQTYSDLQDPDRDLRRIQAIIQSMTPDERANCCQFTPSRQKRISCGSGVSLSMVGELVLHFEAMRATFSQIK